MLFSPPGLARDPLLVRDLIPRTSLIAIRTWYRATQSGPPTDRPRTFPSGAKMTRGENPSGLPQRPEGQSPESSTAWEQHHPKPDEPVRTERVVPEAKGTPHEPEGAGERAAPQHTGHISPCIQIFSLSLPLLIHGIRVLSPQTPRPFPDITAQVLDAI
jgi:hypothetical protein